MVGPVPDEERDSFARKLKAAFVLFVGLSAGLITLQSDAGVVGFLIASGAGIAVGALLLWIAFPSRSRLQDESGTYWENRYDGDSSRETRVRSRRREQDSDERTSGWRGDDDGDSRSRR